MLRNSYRIVVIGFLVGLLSGMGTAQTKPAAPIQTGNDPNYGSGRGGHNTFASPAAIKYVPAKASVERRIDLFFGDWRESMPRAMHGSLVARDILTNGDNFAPPQKAAVLEYNNFFTYATLAAHASTTPEKLREQQEIYYFAGGRGALLAGGDLADLHKDIAVLMPANLEFVMKNTGDEPLTMYIINEPVPAGFRVNTKMLVLDERKAHVRTPDGPDPYIVPGAAGHWAHVVRELFALRDGLATTTSVLTVELPPLSVGEPSPHPPGTEEIWTALEGNSLAWVGSQVRLQKPGMAYMLRPDNMLTHSNINFGDSTIKFLFFARSIRMLDTLQRSPARTQ